MGGRDWPGNRGGKGGKGWVRGERASMGREGKIGAKDGKGRVRMGTELKEKTG